ncbi:hypothetical protein LXL04_015837 [Taraxacum kok-saghyz]
MHASSRVRVAGFLGDARKKRYAGKCVAVKFSNARKISCSDEGRGEQLRRRYYYFRTSHSDRGGFLTAYDDAFTINSPTQTSCTTISVSDHTTYPTLLAESISLQLRRKSRCPNDDRYIPYHTPPSFLRFSTCGCREQPNPPTEIPWLLGFVVGVREQRGLNTPASLLAFSPGEAGRNPQEALAMSCSETAAPCTVTHYEWRLSLVGSPETDIQ